MSGALSPTLGVLPASAAPAARARPRSRAREERSVFMILYLCFRVIWSAVTGRRFGCLADLSARQSRVQRLECPSAALVGSDGDKSPRESGENSPHSKETPAQS